MRVTIDIDKTNPITLFTCLMKGIIVCKRLPKKIRRTSKGFHIVWYGLNIDKRTMLKYRLLIGDDKKRVMLDMKARKRITQVLFCEKIVYYYHALHPRWINRKGEKITVCPVCGHPISVSVKVFTKEKKRVEIYHKDSNHVCTLPLWRW